MFYADNIAEPHIKYDGYHPHRIPLPETDAELEVITYLYFGKILHLSTLTPHYYSVAEDYNSYHGRGYAFSECSCRGYDHSRWFWRKAIAPLTCGGIAKTSYGQFDCFKLTYRHQRRLMKWIANRSNGSNYLRKPFARLAGLIGFPEEQSRF